VYEAERVWADDEPGDDMADNRAEANWAHQHGRENAHQGERMTGASAGTCSMVRLSDSGARGSGDGFDQTVFGRLRPRPCKIMT
jgi:hypothetical protein